MRKTFSLPVAATAAAGGGGTPPPADTVDNIEHSVRFNSADSAYLSRTPSSAGNLKTWTWSAWVKRSSLGRRNLFNAYDGSNITPAGYINLLFDTADKLTFGTGLSNYRVTTQVFRDLSAWYHLVVAVDTTQATANDRVKIYVNGEQVTDFSTTNNPSQNADLAVNGAFAHRLGSEVNQFYLDGYLANIHFIDGQALAPSSFGFTDSNNVWQPKAFSGSYGTNGFYLDFADTSSATALGNDVSGNNNDFTASGLVAGPAYTANSFSTEFDGTGDYLSIPNNSNFAFGTGDFTIEFWAYFQGSGSYETLFDFRPSGQNGNYPTLFRDAVDGDLYYYVNGSRLIDNVSVSNSQWYHIAIAREGTTTKFFLNGAVAASATDSTNYLSDDLYIGSYDGGGNYFTGKVSNFRMIKGRALYTAAFTPPTTALTATDDTVLLTCQDATVRDNSNLGHSVTANGDTVFVNQGPFNGYSGNFDGTGDYLTISNSADHNPGTGDFTIEGWFKTSATVSYQTIMHKYGSPNAYSGYLISLNSAGTGFNVSVFDGSGTQVDLTGGSNLNNGAWHHFAVSRSGTSLKVFIDGTSVATATNSFNLTSTADLRISGIAGNPRDWNGQLSNIRIVKGQALYTANFTPATADFTTTSQSATASNVKLLTCQNKTFVDNSPSAHSITASGNASTISVNPHTDKYSVNFPSSGNNIVCSPPNLTGEFNIECWVKCTGSEIFGNWGTGIFLRYSGTTLQFYSSVINLSVTGRSRDGWHHLAISRDSSNVVRLFEDGKVVDSGTASGTITMSNLTLGAENSTNSSSIVGNISNFRIVDGQALYTSDFLPSTEPLTTTSQGATASNVTLLTCQDYKIQDNSPSPLTLTVNGTAAPSTDAPFVTSGAGSFDGTGDYLNVPANSDFALSGAYTIETWINFESAPTTTVFFGLAGTSTTGNAQLVYSGGALYWQTRGTGANQTSYTWSPATDTWYHIALTWNGSNSFKMFIDGQQVATNTVSPTINQNGINIGGASDGYSVNGYMSNFRISSGLARYTANFTPPTEDFDPADQDTTFLALQGNTLDDLSGNDHAVTANGNAATTTVSPFEPVDGSDAMLDSPTNYGSGDTVRGNYCTLNPVNKATNGGAANGSFEYLSSGGRPNAINGTMAVSSGKWFYESIATNNAYGSGNPTYNAGLVDLDTWDGAFDDPMCRTAGSGFYGYSYRDGYKTVNGTQTSFAASAAINDVIGFALDLDSGELEIYKNGTSLGVLATGLSGTFIPCVESDTTSTGQTATVNFGQQPFKYPVAGYKSWCSTNLPTPAVADGSTAMDVALYAGNNSTQSISTPNMSPDIVWLKARNTAYHHRIFDVIRGQSSLRTDTTNGEGTSTNSTLTSFDSTGFSITNTSDEAGNATGTNYVAWTWDAGSSTVSNTDGSVTSQVRANPTTGVSVVSFASGASGQKTVGHGLNATPSMIIAKSRTDSNLNWICYHADATDTTSKFIRFNTGDALVTYSTIWGAALPSSSVFGITSTGGVAPNTDCIAYCFAPVEGFSSFGSYSGNNSTNGPFIYTGFRPRWILLRAYNVAQNWIVIDVERDIDNPDSSYLLPNSTLVEGTLSPGVDILSNGFKFRTNSSGWNGSGQEFIYAAFAEHPFKTSRAR